ncbi:MAG: hypothetical protein LBI33_06660, partial [Propionibacteriaceae bacterium]|nr:hypothetical protein [Propionibacteriaceae bacterium]
MGNNEGGLIPQFRPTPPGAPPTWEVAVDTSALAPDDPGVTSEIDQRLATGDLKVVPTALPADPLSLRVRRLAGERTWGSVV